jgi:hypothetical protein
MLDFLSLLSSLFVLAKGRSNRRGIMMVYYTALPFVRLENGGLVPGEAVECPHSSAVMQRADAMVRDGANVGAVALAHIESPGLGDFEDRVILKTFGEVPEDFECLRS